MQPTNDFQFNCYGAKSQAIAEQIKCYMRWFKPGEYVAPIFQRALADLAEGPSASNIAELYNPLNLDIPRLSDDESYRKRESKPRIDVDMEVTKNGNFSLTWRPTNWHSQSPENTCDFRRYLESSSRSRLTGDPFGELIFFHDYNDINDLIVNNETRWGNLPQTLLYGLHSMVVELVNTLSRRSHVRLITNIYITQTRSNEPGARFEFKSIELENVADREDRLKAQADQAQAEHDRAMFNDPYAYFGFTYTDLKAAQAAVGTKTPTGRNMAPKQYPAYLLAELNGTAAQQPPLRQHRLEPRISVRSGLSSSLRSQG